MSLFSVIIPVHNSEEFLLPTVQSVLKQNFSDLEIIIVNDFSTDGSAALCDKLAREHPFIRVIHNPKNLGISSTRNLAIRAAKGRYLIFLDSDDLLFEGSLSGIAQIIKEREPDLVIARYSSERYQLRGASDVPEDFTFDNAAIDVGDPNGAVAHLKDFTKLAGVCWRFSVNREFFIKNDLFFIDSRVMEDQEYVARVLCLAKRFAFYEKCLYLYRARAGSITESITRAVNFGNSAACLKVAGELNKFIAKNKLTPMKKDFLEARIKNALALFVGHLPLFSNEDIQKFAKLIEDYAEYHAASGMFYEKSGINSILGKPEPYKNLLAFKDSIVQQTKAVVRGAEKKPIYVFCADLFGKVTAHILKHEGFDVRAFWDNNKALQGAEIVGLPVQSPVVLKEIKNPSGIFVVVCHQKKNAFENISNQLFELGLKPEQITHYVL